MEKYVAARPDVFFTGKDGSLRSNRAYAQVAGQYAVDMFIGSTLQIDQNANSSTVVSGRLAGFGGAPNMGHDPRGRRHSTEAWLDLMTSDDPLAKGRKLVVQTVETFQNGNTPVFVDTLDAVEVAKKSGLATAPVMIYGDDVTHVVTEEGIAYTYKAEGEQERRDALSAIAGVTSIGQRASAATIQTLREKGVVAYPEDLGIQRTQAKRSLLAAKNVQDLVEQSGGLYNPPAKFKNW
jgi:malonate decarboxylase alpha subunit